MSSLSTINISVVEFILILTAFYHLPISLLLFTHSLIDALEYALVGIYYTLNKWPSWKLYKLMFQNIHVLIETTLTVEKKHFVLVLSLLSSISLQTRINLKKSLTKIPKCLKTQIVLKNKTRLGKKLVHFKHWIPRNPCL